MTTPSTIRALSFATSIAISQPCPETNVTSVDLARAVFDDMMDKDLLGLLLSSTHFHKYLAAYSTYARKEHSQAIRLHMTNVDLVNQFHQQMLKMYAGSFIAESSIKVRADLLAALEAKYQAFIEEHAIHEDVRFETTLQELDSIEMAWKYRNACGIGKPAPFDF